MSSRFHELQGLRVALAGLTIAIVFGTYLAAGHPTDTGGLIALGVAFVLMIPGQVWAHHYYARTVGRQVPKPRNRFLTIVLLNLYFAFGVYIDKRFPEIPAGGPTLQVVVLFSLLVAIRDWPWRAHYLGVAVVVATAFCVNVFGVDVIDRGMTLAMTLLATGVAMVPAGLLDHRLLMKLMKEVRQPETASVRASSD